MEVAVIFEQFHSALLAFIQGKVRSKEDAEDILQNVFVRVSASVGKLREDEKLASWLYTIARNAVIDYYRANAVTKGMLLHGEMHFEIPAEGVVDYTKGLEHCIGMMIGLLPEEYRQIITESEIHGVKQKDLAKKLGMPYPSVRSRVQRGRERLKQLFHTCCQVDTDRFGNVLAAKRRADCGDECKSCSDKEW